MADTPLSLVTGAAGFIGSHLADELVTRGHTVIGLDDLSGGLRSNVSDGIELVVGDICDADLVEDLIVGRQVDYVFHLAAYAAEGLSHFIRRFNYHNNLVGTMAVLNASVRSGTVRRFVFTSSIAVYGATRPPMREDGPIAPEDPYGIAKYAAELDIAAASRLFGLPYTIFRPHNVYGERQNLADRYRNVVGIFMNHAMRGAPFPVFGDGNQRRAFTHIADVAPLIAASIDLAGAENEIFNVGGDVPFTVNELAGVVAEAMGVDLVVEHRPARDEVIDAWSDHTKLRSVFGPADGLVTLRDGIDRMATWARTIGPTTPSTFEGIEVDRHLPPAWRDAVAAAGSSGR